MNSAEKARMAQEALKNQKNQKKQNRKKLKKEIIDSFGLGFFFYVFLNIVAVIGVIVTVIIEIKGIKADAGVPDSFRPFFFIGIGILVYLLILLIFGFKLGKQLGERIPNYFGEHVPGRQYYRDERGFNAITNEYYYHDHLAASPFYIGLGLLNTVLFVGMLVLLAFSLFSGNL